MSDRRLDPELRGKPGPKPIGERAMTSTERVQRYRAKKRAAARQRGYAHLLLTEADWRRMFGKA